ncbi:MAG TPA: hypothetical protein VNV82_17790 [Bryobacteraceae bacterium]|jgi:hypothetical protein|nr:hypothetical protein [Bryobacteraceae bacterium]
MPDSKNISVGAYKLRVYNDVPSGGPARRRRRYRPWPAGKAWPKGKKRGRRSLAVRRRCRGPRQVQPMSEERAREVRARFGPYEGESYFDHPLGLLRFYQRMPRPIQDPRERVACKMALDYKEREAAQPKPKRPIGRPKVALLIEAVDRLRGEGWSERRIAAELRISRRTVARKYPKIDPLKKEFCATTNANGESDLSQKTPAPPSYSPSIRIDSTVSGEGMQARKTEELAANLPRRPKSPETENRERGENQRQKPENGEKPGSKTSNDRENRGAENPESKQPSERDIAAVRTTFAGLVELDRAAIVVILQALRTWAAKRPEFPREFIREAPRRMVQYSPMNRTGFLIKMARDGKVYGEGRFLTDAQCRADDACIARESDIETFEVMLHIVKTKEERDDIKRRIAALKGADCGTL